MRSPMRSTQRSIRQKPGPTLGGGAREQPLDLLGLQRLLLCVRAAARLRHVQLERLGEPEKRVSVGQVLDIDGGGRERRERGEDPAVRRVRAALAGHRHEDRAAVDPAPTAHNFRLLEFVQERDRALAVERSPAPVAEARQDVYLEVCTEAIPWIERKRLFRASSQRWPFVAGTWTLVVSSSVGSWRLQVVGLFKRMRGTAFAWWDTWLFVPLCLLIAPGCLVVALSER